MKQLPHLSYIFFILTDYSPGGKIESGYNYLYFKVILSFKCSDRMASILLKPKRKNKHRLLTFLYEFSFDKRAFQTAATSYENKPASSRHPRSKAKTAPTVDSKTWFSVCHLYRQPSYIWLNRRNLFIDNSSSLFFETVRTDDLQTRHGRVKSPYFSASRAL